MQEQAMGTSEHRDCSNLGALYGTSVLLWVKLDQRGIAGLVCAISWVSLNDELLAWDRAHDAKGNLCFVGENDAMLSGLAGERTASNRFG